MAALACSGRELVFSLETASDYVRDERAGTFGFRCLATGCAAGGGGERGVQRLEHELAHLGGTCAATLMRRNMPLPAVAGEPGAAD